MSALPGSKNIVRKLIVTLWLLLFFKLSYGIDYPISHFPLKAYSQNIFQNFQLNKDRDNNLLKTHYQRQQRKQFYQHYYASGKKGLSPWSSSMVEVYLPKLKKIEQQTIDDFINENNSPVTRHYGENFKRHGKRWFNKINERMDLANLYLDGFKKEKRAIAINNTFARALPLLVHYLSNHQIFFILEMRGRVFPLIICKCRLFGMVHRFMFLAFLKIKRGLWY